MVAGGYTVLWWLHSNIPQISLVSCTSMILSHYIKTPKGKYISFIALHHPNRWGDIKYLSTNVFSQF